jgi:zinc and cadmium transporter
MMNSLLSVSILSFIGSILGFLGGLILVLNEKLTKKYSLHLISFAAGVILAITFLDILPEALSFGGEQTFLLVLIGLVGFFLVEDHFLHLHHHEGDMHPMDTATPLLLVVSDAVHNFIDGVAIAASFLADPKLGLMVALATLLHEIPKETGDFAILLSSGYSKKKAFTVNFLTALASLLGATLTVFLSGKTIHVIGPLLGIAAGMFLYIAASDILPKIVGHGEKNIKWHTTGFFLLGILLIYCLTKFIPG